MCFFKALFADFFILLHKRAKFDVKFNPIIVLFVNVANRY